MLLQIPRTTKRKRARRGQSLRSRTIIGLLIVGTVPALSLGLFLAERSADLRQERMMGRLEETASTTARSIDLFIDKHRAGVMTAASAASASGNFDRQSMTRWLLLYHRIYSDFLTMLSADSSGNITTATSNMTGFLTAVPELLAHNVSDRPYFRQPMQDGAVFVSRVFQGRDLGRDPIVAISAPLLGRDNERLGIVEGSLNLRAFSRIDNRRVQWDASEMILVDQDNRVIYASPSTSFTKLQSITTDPLISSATGSGAGYEYTAGTLSTPYQFLAASARTETGWTVYFRAPLAQISQQVLGDYLVGAFALLGASILSLILAGVIVRQVTRTIDDMNRAVASFRLDGSEGRVQTPANTPAEFRPIFKHMRKRSAQLRRTHKRLSNSINAGERLQKELTQAIALKEVEVAERTAELEEANEKLSGLSKIDALTGIPNRREYDSFAKRVWKVGAREKSAVALIMLDIDYFKPYNDSLGHQSGDECLVQVAQALKACATRPLDLVARYGGEEFIAILGGAKVDDALTVAERMRNAVFSLQIPHPASPHKVVTVSIGVASSIPVPSSDPTQAVKAADEALYEAKAAGRNSVVYLKEHGFHVHSNKTPRQGKPSVVPLRS